MTSKRHEEQSSSGYQLIHTLKHFFSTRYVLGIYKRIARRRMAHSTLEERHEWLGESRGNSTLHFHQLQLTQAHT